jgi:hypothetical protein
MALLPFLGAGETHQSGKYQKNVKAGLDYLVTHIQRKDQGGSFEDGGRLYSHGLASIALCEAYAMTQDRWLMKPAQEAIDYIVYAQDPRGGGWRYKPRERGDTSVLGWQLMALKSGHMAYLVVPPPTIKRAVHFLDSVTPGERRATYGYMDTRDIRDGTTAVGLLCRMYLGWQHDHPSLKLGVQLLGSKGPSMNIAACNIYYNYYATQVMRHYEGPPWEKWNTAMRDWLVATQSKSEHMTGSWYVGGDLGSGPGGRLYCTSLATMILEVYYRHMPIYSKQAASHDLFAEVGVSSENERAAAQKLRLAETFLRANKLRALRFAHEALELGPGTPTGESAKQFIEKHQ